MSVLKSKRDESVIEFINTARELNMHTIRQCVKFPKRYTFFVSQDIVSLSNEIYEDVVKANAINPSNRHEAQTRKDLLIAAHTSCESLVAKIALAKELFPIEEKPMIRWMEFINKEQRLLKGAIKHDDERYKSLLTT